MEPFALPVSPHHDIAIFGAGTQAGGAGWQTWVKPVGKAYANILVIGPGGGGGSGTVGNPSSAGGGGGGGSGGMTVIEIPLDFLPPRLYVSVPNGRVGTGSASSTIVAVMPNGTTAHTLVTALGGSGGGNASGATAGAAGSGAAAATSSLMPLGWGFVKQALAGQAGITGSGNNNAASLTLPVTGIRMTGGTGGGGLGSTATASREGGHFVIPAAPTYFPTHMGGLSTSATAPANPGEAGYRIDGGPGGYFFYGGTGSSSTAPTATGSGLVQASGGNGGIGSGGGGNGGARTGSVAAPVSQGGPGLVVITCY